MLTDQQIKARDGKLTASRVACLMSGDKEKILNLWKELVGDPSYVPEDLSEVWAVRLGEATEHLNLDWYVEKTNARIIKRGEVMVHRTIPWAAATIDGWVPDLECPIEAKCVGGFERFETIVDRYMPQLHWQMIVTDASKCVFSVIEGAREPRVEIIKYDNHYGLELLERATKFMECVRTLTSPVDMPAVAAPVVPIKSYDMTGNNAWASAAADWLEHRMAAKKFDKSTEEIKSLVPADAILAHGHNISASRDKASRLKIVEKK